MVKKPHKKLTPEQVREIRRLAEQNESQRKIAVIFSINQSHVGQIVRREIWKKVI